MLRDKIAKIVKEERYNKEWITTEQFVNKILAEIPEITTGWLADIGLHISHNSNIGRSDLADAINRKIRGGE